MIGEPLTPETASLLERLVQLERAVSGAYAQARSALADDHDATLAILQEVHDRAAEGLTGLMVDGRTPPPPQDRPSAIQGAAKAITAVAGMLGETPTYKALEQSEHKLLECYRETSRVEHMPPWCEAYLREERLPIQTELVSSLSALAEGTASAEGV